MATSKGTQTQQEENRQQQNQPAQNQQNQQQTGSMQRTGRESEQQRGLSRQGSWSSNPFAMMDRFADEMDQLFENFGFGRSLLAPVGRHSLSGFSSQGLWSPQIEVFEREGQLVVRADLPGLNKDDVKVNINNNLLTIQGERRYEHEENQQGVFRSERSYGTFHRAIPLPEGVNANEAKANFRDGVLEITIPEPQQQKQRGRQVEIS